MWFDGGKRRGNDDDDEEKSSSSSPMNIVIGGIVIVLIITIVILIWVFTKSKSEADSLEDEKNKLTSQLTLAQQNQAAFEKEKKAALDSVATLQSTIKAKQASIDEVAKTLETANADLIKKNNEINAKQIALNNLIASKDKAIADGKQAEADRLADEIGTYRSQIGTLESDKTALNNKITGVGGLNSQITQLNSEKTLALSRISELETNLDTAKKAAVAALSAADAAKEAKEAAEQQAKEAKEAAEDAVKKAKTQAEKDVADAKLRELNAVQTARGQLLTGTDAEVRAKLSEAQTAELNTQLQFARDKLRWTIHKVNNNKKCYIHKELSTQRSTTGLQKRLISGITTVDKCAEAAANYGKTSTKAGLSGFAMKNGNQCWSAETDDIFRTQYDVFGEGNCDETGTAQIYLIAKPIPPEINTATTIENYPLDPVMTLANNPSKLFARYIQFVNPNKTCMHIARVEIWGLVGTQEKLINDLTPSPKFYLSSKGTFSAEDITKGNLQSDINNDRTLTVLNPDGTPNNVKMLFNSPIDGSKVVMPKCQKDERITIDLSEPYILTKIIVYNRDFQQSNMNGVVMTVYGVSNIDYPFGSGDISSAEFEDIPKIFQYTFNANIFQNYIFSFPNDFQKNMSISPQSSSGLITTRENAIRTAQTAAEIEKNNAENAASTTAAQKAALKTLREKARAIQYRDGGSAAVGTTPAVAPSPKCFINKTTKNNKYGINLQLTPATTSLQECADIAKAKGLTAFAMINGNQCWGASADGSTPDDNFFRANYDIFGEVNCADSPNIAKVYMRAQDIPDNENTDTQAKIDDYNALTPIKQLTRNSKKIFTRYIQFKSTADKCLHIAGIEVYGKVDGDYDVLITSPERDPAPQYYLSSSEIPANFDKPDDVININDITQKGILFKPDTNTLSKVVMPICKKDESITIDLGEPYEVNKIIVYNRNYKQDSILGSTMTLYGISLVDVAAGSTILTNPIYKYTFNRTFQDYIFNFSTREITTGATGVLYGGNSYIENKILPAQSMEILTARATAASAAEAEAASAAAAKLQQDNRSAAIIAAYGAEITGRNYQSGSYFDDTLRPLNDAKALCFDGDAYKNDCIGVIIDGNNGLMVKSTGKVIPGSKTFLPKTSSYTVPLKQRDTDRINLINLYKNTNNILQNTDYPGVDFDIGGGPKTLSGTYSLEDAFVECESKPDCVMVAHIPDGNKVFLKRKGANPITLKPNPYKIIITTYKGTKFQQQLDFEALDKLKKDNVSLQTQFIIIKGLSRMEPDGGFNLPNNADWNAFPFAMVYKDNNILGFNINTKSYLVKGNKPDFTGITSIFPDVDSNYYLKNPSINNEFSNTFSNVIYGYKIVVDSPTNNYIGDNWGTTTFTDDETKSINKDGQMGGIFGFLQPGEAKTPKSYNRLESLYDSGITLNILKNGYRDITFVNFILNKGSISGDVTNKIGFALATVNKKASLSIHPVVDKVNRPNVYRLVPDLNAWFIFRSSRY